jgi:dihydrolipoamide dehydrogenase
MSKYDVVVIGSGPGGYVAAVRAAHNGLKVAIVEKDTRLGGTCTLRGCIPTKALLHSADLVSELAHAKDSGIVVSDVKIDIAGVQKSRAKVVDKSVAGIGYLMKSNKIDVHMGKGSVKSATKVTVEADGKTTELDTKNIILAMGSVVRPLPSLKIDGKRVVSSDEILELNEIPKSLLVLGAGAVGVEFASVYSRFGTEVTIVEMMDRLLPIEDEEVSAEFGKAFRKRGIKALLGTKLEKAEVKADGVVATLASVQGGTQEVKTDMVLVAVGRAPVTQSLGLEQVGVKLDKRGFVEVDGFMRTARASSRRITSPANTRTRSSTRTCRRAHTRIPRWRASVSPRRPRRTRATP